ncbi:MAG TPA: hypothetical protein VK960_10540 [Acidimicrobiia bacterium]|nr:hypothetical protein [Acidimicrobiia bacterium]
MTWQIFATRPATAEGLTEGLTKGTVAHKCIVVDAGDLPAVVGDALDRGFRRIGVEGEDPILAATIEEIRARGVGRQTDLVVVSRTSDLMRTFAADQTVAGAVDRMVNHTPYLVDAGHIEGDFGQMVFVNSVAAGVLAGGPGWFPWWPWPLLPVRGVAVASGDSATEAVASGALVLNGQFWGDRVVAPRSTTVDGMLDIQMYNGHRIALSRLRRTMRTGMHVRSHHVRRRSLAGAFIDAPAAWRVSVDGIRIGKGAFRVTCLPGAVRLAI